MSLKESKKDLGVLIVDEREKFDPGNRNGYEPFPECIVISTERSGLNFVRYVIEKLTPMRTPGKVHIHKRGKLLFHRTHDVFYQSTLPGRTHVLENGRDRYSRALLLLRDPREIFVRASKKNWNHFRAYCENLKYFDEFSGEKKLIYYDDLITKDEILKEIFEFLNIEQFFKLEKIATLREESVDWYEKNQQIGGGSMTKGSQDLLTFHQKTLTKEELDQLALYLKEHLPSQLHYFNRWNESKWL